VRRDGDEVITQLVAHPNGHLADGGKTLKLSHALAGAWSTVDERAHVE
jgi:hypothetical protein